jgi:hypothetical protein
MLHRLLLVAVLSAACHASAAFAAGSDGDTIRALRAANNHAIATRNTAALTAVWSPNISLSGGDGTLYTGGAKALAKSYATDEFVDPTFVSYARKPARIEISTDGKRAAEEGSWVGTWRAPHPKRASGKYFALWHKVNGSWKILHESYVTLDRTAR